MRRYPTSSFARSAAYAFGPGPLSPGVKWLIVANVAAYVVSLLVSLTPIFGFSPQAVLEQYWLWQLATYMFLHGDLMHILFNMLALWMFGVELERMWGTRFFLRYYFITGVGAALTTLGLALLPVGFGEQLYRSTTIGASGAVYGLLLAFAIYYPNRPILMFMVFPVPARVFVIIIGAIAFLSSISQPQGGIAHVAHLGGLLAGYAYLKRGRGGVLADVRYRYVKWKMNRLKKKFDVYSGGRGPKIH